MYNGINISVGTLISSWDVADELKIPRVRHMHNSRCENLHFCDGSLIMKNQAGERKCEVYVAEFCA
jgi:hypothetical protein